MPEAGARLVDRSSSPSDDQLRHWLGEEAYSHWYALCGWIDENYPGIFEPDWVFGGAKHGWSLRYKKTKSFCTLVPEYGRLSVVIVFGKDERQKVEAMLGDFSPSLARLYEETETFHDGKWLKLSLPSEAGPADIARLLSTKRRPRPRPEESLTR